VCLLLVTLAAPLLLLIALLGHELYSLVVKANDGTRYLLQNSWILFCTAESAFALRNAVRRLAQETEVGSTHKPSPLPSALVDMTADRPMTAQQAATLKQLAEAAYDLEAFQPNLTRAEADLRIAMLTAKLKLLDEPPHTL
jgi:DUF3072 family protein